MEQASTKAKASLRVREVVMCGVFAAITAVLSQVSVPIGPVPISCSLIAVYLSGLLLSVKPALFSQVVYLLLGVIGVPVFAGFQSGVARLAGPTGGYLAVYPILAVLISAMMLFYDKKLANTALPIRAVYLAGTLLLALLVCYAAGTAWFTVFSGSTFQKALSLTVLPFIPGDIAKIVLCIVVTLLARPQLKKAMQGK